MQVDLPIILSVLLLLQMKSGKKRTLLRFSVLALALGSEYNGASQSKSRMSETCLFERSKKKKEANQLFEVLKSRQL